MEGVARDTVLRLLCEVGQQCIDFHDKHVQRVRPKRIEADEIWSFCYAKWKTVERGVKAPQDVMGDVWTWTALDPDSKLIVSWYVGERSTYSAIEFMQDLRSRVMGKPRITTDGLYAYLNAVEVAFGGDCTFAQLVKQYDANGHYKTAEKRAVTGKPDMSKVSTSLVERQNLTMRQSMRRFTRQTTGFSKRVANHCYMLAIYFTWYNFCREHTTLRYRTPAMAAGLAKRTFSMVWLANGLHVRRAEVKTTTC